MTTIPPTPYNTGNQLNGILNTLPAINRPAPTLADGSPYSFSLGNVSLGGPGPEPFVISATAGTLPGHLAAAASGTSGGGDTVPANGAQPAAPGTTTAAPTAGTPPATTTVTTEPLPAVTTSTTPDAAGAVAAVEANAAPLSGFGKAERAKPMVAGVDGAKFSFPSFKQSAKTDAAPKITWGPGWTKVEKNGMWYMQHANGTKAIPATEFRITPSPADKVQTIKVANGWGKKFPDGSILVFDRTEGAYRLDAKGQKHKVALGNQVIGGVKVRVFEASVVRTLEANGAVTVFTSRGQTNAGSKRGHMAAAVATAGGGAQQLASGSPTQGGGSVGQMGNVSQGGGPMTPAQLTARVQKLTAEARQLLAQVNSGTIDAAGLQSLQSHLSELPSGIRQALGAAGAMTAVAAGGSTDLPPTVPGSTAAAAATPTTPVTRPTPGNDVQANAIKAMAAGTKLTVEAGAVPAELVGKQARFAQLPEAVQLAIAKAAGSDQGAAAFEADSLFAFAAGGAVTLVDADKAYLKHVPQVRGAGPGEDLALTVRPTRQPGATTGASTTGGGSAGTAASGTTTARPVTGAGATVAATTIPANAKRISVFQPGNTMRSPAFNGIAGAHTWTTLPAPAKQAIMSWLKTHASSPAGKAFAARTGSGWAINPGSSIVITNGVANFVGGLDIFKATISTTGGGSASQNDPNSSLPPVSGGQTGHNATIPPVTGGGGTGGTGGTNGPPGVAPPVPAIADPGEHTAHAGHVMN